MAASCSPWPGIPFSLQDDVPTKWATPERLQYHSFNYIFHFSKLFMLPILKRQIHDIEQWNYLFPAYPSPNSLSPNIIIFNSFSLCVWGVMWLPPNFYITMTILLLPDFSLLGITYYLLISYSVEWYDSPLIGDATSVI